MDRTGRQEGEAPGAEPLRGLFPKVHFSQEVLPDPSSLPERSPSPTSSVSLQESGDAAEKVAVSRGGRVPRARTQLAEQDTLGPRGGEGIEPAATSAPAV